MRLIRDFVGVAALALLFVALMIGDNADLTSEPLDTPASGQSVSGQGGLHTEIGQGVKGRVMSLTSSPVRNTLIKAKSLDIPAQAVPEIAILTDDDGYYLWPLRPGDYEIKVVIDQNEAASERVTVRPREITRLDFHLSE